MRGNIYQSMWLYVSAYGMCGCTRLGICECIYLHGSVRAGVCVVVWCMSVHVDMCGCMSVHVVYMSACVGIYVIVLGVWVYVSIYVSYVSVCQCM